MCRGLTAGTDQLLPEIQRYAEPQVMPLQAWTPLACPADKDSSMPTPLAPRLRGSILDNLDAGSTGSTGNYLEALLAPGHQTALCDDAGDEPGRRHIKGWVPHLHRAAVSGFRWTDNLRSVSGKLGWKHLGDLGEESGRGSQIRRAGARADPSGSPATMPCSIAWWQMPH